MTPRPSLALRRYEYRHRCGNVVQVRAMDALPDPCPSCHLSGVTWELLQAWDADGKVIGGRMGETPRVAEEKPLEHATNALTALQYYREARGSGWHQVLSRPDIQVAELAAVLESVEARLRLALGQ